MTNISQVDQAIVLLQERLRRIRKEAAKPASASTIKVQSTTVRSHHQLENLLALEALPQKALTRAYGQATVAWGYLDTSDGYVGSSQSGYTYDQSGRLLNSQVNGQAAETFVYDGLGRLTASVDLNGGTTS